MTPDMTRNQRLSRALMYRLIGAATCVVAIVHIGIGRYGIAAILMAVCLPIAALMLFNREEAKHL